MIQLWTKNYIETISLIKYGINVVFNTLDLIGMEDLRLLIPKFDIQTENVTTYSRMLPSTTNNDRRCTALPKSDMDCCKPGDDCGVGEGDCDNDEDCANGLKCGNDNCYYDFPTTDIRDNWDITADCCYGDYF